MANTQSGNQIVTIATADIEIGAVELKNGTDDTRAKIGALTGVVSSDNGLPVTDPIANAALGTTSGSAVITDTTGTIQQYLRGLVKLLITSGTIILGAGTAAIGKLSANSGVDIGDVDVTSITAGETHIGEVGGKSVVINSSFTRPSDTTTYAAGEVVGPTAGAAVMTFTNCARVNAGSGVITHATLVDGASVATKGSFELWLYDTTFTADADNAVFTPTDAELLTVVGVIPMTLAYVGDATVGVGGNAVYMGTVDRPIPFVTGASSRNLFGAIVVRNAYVPVSAETFDVRLFIDQN